jgi:hypothetical protein
LTIRIRRTLSRRLTHPTQRGPHRQGRKGRGSRGSSKGRGASLTPSPAILVLSAAEERGVGRRSAPEKVSVSEGHETDNLAWSACRGFGRRNGKRHPGRLQSCSLQNASENRGAPGASRSLARTGKTKTTTRTRCLQQGAPVDRPQSQKTPCESRDCPRHA